MFECTLLAPICFSNSSPVLLPSPSPLLSLLTFNFVDLSSTNVFSLLRKEKKNHPIAKPILLSKPCNDLPFENAAAALQLHSKQHSFIKTHLIPKKRNPLSLICSHLILKVLKSSLCFSAYFLFLFLHVSIRVLSKCSTLRNWSAL